ncbi:MAG: ABC transporter substrate-binding protein [Rhodothermaceae bacterium]|nr:ABC transporter substrate-binding protein [Rhodothermaceae bacterium]
MKIDKVVVSICIVLTTVSAAGTVHSQNYDDQFQEAMEFYEQGRYLEAASLFDDINAPEARLFAGKSYFAAGMYIDAIEHLNTATVSGVRRVADEAAYTLALSYFQTKQYGRSLDLLYATVNDPGIVAALRNDARTFYNETMAWLSPAQRRLAYTHSQVPDVQRQLLLGGIEHHQSDTGASLLEVFARHFNLSDDDPDYRNARKLLENRIDREELRPDILDFPAAPGGLVFNIGVLLPAFEPGSEPFGVSQGLYYGIMMAADEFNRRNPDKKVRLHYSDDSDPAAAFSKLVWNYNVDLIIGPLFSESVSVIAPLAEKYGIPVLAPLANCDDLNRDYAYLYQSNPTFSARGKKMAEFAVSRMGFRRLAIMVEKNSLGVDEAMAFRDEAERLGATIVHFFLEDFGARAFDITDFTIHFSDPNYLSNLDPGLFESIDLKPVDALYIPFTGQAAPTLINLVLTDLQANRSDAVVLGSQELGMSEINSDFMQYFRMYYTETMDVEEGNEDVINYRIDYKNRFGVDANKFGFVGYDTSNFIFRSLEEIRNPDLLNYHLRFRPAWNGLSTILDFKGTYVNQGVQIHRIDSSGNVKVY